jgi:hypothetical protein
MKKALLLLTVIVTITACQSAQNPNANLNSNARNENSNQGASVKAACDSNSDEKVVMEVVIQPGPTFIPDTVNDITITANQSVVWCISNQSGMDIRVVIGNLRNKLDCKDINPFGTIDFKDNFFSSRVISDGARKNLRTKKPHKGVGNTYKYDILLTDEDGEILDFLDPQVVINQGFPRELTGNKNTNSKNANAAK